MANYLRELGAGKIDTAVDPTLLLKKEDWLKLVTRKDSTCNYVLTYSVRGDKNHMLSQLASGLCEQENLRIIRINDGVSPLEFLTLIYNAKCIITSSFHATVFSILFERPFWSVAYEDEHDARYANLLNMLNLKSQLVTKGFKPYVPSIDYSCVRKRLEELRNRSLSLLGGILPKGC